MFEFEDLLLHSIWTITLSLTFCLLLVIWMYLSKKPLGMQTVFDDMIKDLIILRILLVISSASINLDLGLRPWNPTMAFMAVLFQHAIAFALIMQVFATVLIRHLSIFHGTMINDLSDSQIIWTSRISISATSIMVTAWEWYEENLGYGPGFQAMTNSSLKIQEAKPLLSLMILMVLTLVLNIFVQVRIEQENVKMTGSNAGLNRFEEVRSNLSAGHPMWDGDYDLFCHHYFWLVD